MKEPRAGHFSSRNAHGGSTALGRPTREVFRWRGTAGGSRLRVALRSAFGDGGVPFVVKLWADAAVFAVAACAIVFAVWGQDPGAQAVAGPPATRVAARLRYAPARGIDGPAMLPVSRQVAHRGNWTVPAANGG